MGTSGADAGNCEGCAEGETMNERNIEIINLWNDNVTAQAIGKKLGVTRNTIIGVVTRARELGYITRPMVMSASEKGRMGNIVKYGYRKNKAQRA
jgi:hypothetical protein